MSPNPPIKTKLRSWILALASDLGLFRLFGFFNRRKVAILFYHGVSAREKFTGIENYQGKHVRASRFREHLRWLSKRYRVLPLPDVVHAIQRGLPLPDYSAVITFDDGYENNVTVALPHLHEAGLTATFFVSTSFIGTDNSLWVDQVEAVLNSQEREHVFVRFDSREERILLTTVVERRNADRRIRSYCKQLPEEEKERWLAAFYTRNGIVPPKASGEYRFMSWDQVGELQAGGMTIGSHTLTHAIVTRLTERNREREIGEARQACEDALGVACETFAYPNGRLGDFDSTTSALLRRLDFSCGLTSVHGHNARGSDLFTLKRIGVGDATSVRELEMHISGFTCLALRLRRSLKN